MGLSLETHRFIIAGIFLIAGLLHFLKPNVFIGIMPDYIPYHLPMVYISGLAEMMGAVGLVIPQTQIWGGVGLILLLFAVFPANINMALESVSKFGYLSWYSIATLLRLPLQFVLIYWIYWASLM